MADFGARGFEVPAGTGLSVRGRDRQELEIYAAEISLNAKVQAKNSSLTFVTTGDVVIGERAKIQLRSPIRYQSALRIYAGGDFVNLGSDISVKSGGSTIAIESSGVLSDSGIVATGSSYDTSVSIVASMGDVTVDGAVTALTTATDGLSTLTIDASGKVAVGSLIRRGGGELDGQDDYGDSDAAELIVTARSGGIDVSGNVNSNAGVAEYLRAGDIYFTAAGDVNVGGSISALSYGKAGSTSAAGDVTIRPGARRDVSIGGSINVYSPKPTLWDHNEVRIGPACGISIGGSIYLHQTSPAPILDDGHC